MTVAASPDSALRPEWWGDAWRIGFIIAIALAARSWLVAHTEVLSRDSVGYIRLALQIEEPPPSKTHPDRSMTRAEVLRATFQAPGYPLSILAVSWPVRAVMGETTCRAMDLSAQLASILASLLLVFPMYYLGKLAFDRQTAFLAALIFQVLPIDLQVSSDGLSDSLFLLGALTALWLAAIGFRRSSIWWFGLAGMAGGLAYLVRPEGFLAVVVIGGVLLLSRLRGDIRWRQLLARGTLLLAGSALVMSPYVMTIGRLTNKPTGSSLFRWLGGEEMKPTWVLSTEPEPEPAVGLPLGIWYPGYQSGDKPSGAWAGKALGKEFLKTSFYVLPLFGLIGFVVLWPRLRHDPCAALIVAFGVCQSALVWLMAKGAGYVAERHTLPIVLCNCYFAAASVAVVGGWLARVPYLKRIGKTNFWSAYLAVVFVAVSLPFGLKTLHANRAGHREVGMWIGSQAKSADYVLDPFAWAEYYSGRMRVLSDYAAHPRVAYIVVESDANQHPRLHFIHFARYFAERSQLVHHWPQRNPPAQAKILVYRWEGDNFPEIWQAAFDYHQKVITDEAQKSARRSGGE